MFGDAGEVVGDVPEVRLYLLVDASAGFGGDPVERAGERDDGALEFKEFAFELVDAAGVGVSGAVRGEDVGFDLVAVVLDGVGDGDVVVDDVVGDGVQDG